MTPKQAILGKLMRNREVASWQLADHTLQYNARIYELRQLGFDIIACKKVSGTDAYKLLTPHDEIDFKECKLKQLEGSSDE